MLSIEKVYSCTNVQEALDFLSEDEKAIPLAAGTDIVPMLRDGISRNARLVDIHDVKELDYIVLEDGLLRIGAMTTHQTIARNEIIKKTLPALAYACGQVGSAQIRRRATIGGNICHASPAGDTLPVLIAADACAVIKTKDYTKTMLLESFITAPRKTQIPRGGLLQEVSILIPEGGWKGNFYKVGGRSALTISTASVAVLGDAERIHVAYGSMSARVQRIHIIEEFLENNRHAGKEVIKSIVKGCLSPISDIRASKEYRLEVASNLTWLGYHELQDYLQ